MARAQLEPAYVLHRRPYRETSLLVEAFARGHGRVGLVARGARGDRSTLRGALQPFRPCLLSWSGRQELMTLTAAEAAGGAPIEGRALLAGLYLNELLIRLLPRSDPHPALYDDYTRTLGLLASDEDQEPVLRVFEKRLLEALGYGMVLGGADAAGRPLEPERTYRYQVETGPLPEDHSADGVAVRGATLLAVAEERIGDRALAREAKQLMRYVLQHYLGDRPLESRSLFQRPASGRGP